MDRPSILKPTLIGGGVFGLLGSIPIVNCLCCALMAGGGLLATYLHANDCKRLGLAFGAGHGARVGLVAGLFYAIVNAIIGGLLTIVIGRSDPAEALEMLERFNFPPEAMDSVEPMIELLNSPVGVAIQLAVSLVIAVVFSTIGGLIGGAAFKAEAARPAPPSAPQPPTQPMGG